MPIGGTKNSVAVLVRNSSGRLVDTSFDAIEQFPEMFARVHGEVRRAMVSRFPYAVFYRIEPKQVVVLTVLHTARDPRLWPQPRRRAR